MPEDRSERSPRSARRGASHVEILVIVGVVGTLGLAAIRLLGDASGDKAGRQAGCLQSFSCADGQGSSSVLDGLVGASSSSRPTEEQPSDGVGITPWNADGVMPASVMTAATPPPPPAPAPEPTPTPAPPQGGGTLADFLAALPSAETNPAARVEGLVTIASAVFAELDSASNPPSAARAAELLAALEYLDAQGQAIDQQSWSNNALSAEDYVRIVAASSQLDRFARSGREREFQVRAAESNEGALGNFAKGFFVDGAWGTLEGIGNAVLHPIVTGEALVTAVSHPIVTLGAMKDGLVASWKESPARVLGGGFFTVVTAPLTATKGGQVATLLRETSGAAHLVDDLTSVGVPAVRALTRAEAALARMDALPGSAIVGVVDVKTGQIVYHSSRPRWMSGEDAPPGFLPTNGGHTIAYTELTGRAPTWGAGGDVIAFTITREGLKWKSGSVNDILTGNVEGPWWMQEEAIPILESEFGDVIRHPETRWPDGLE